MDWKNLHEGYEYSYKDGKKYVPVMYFKQGSHDDFIFVDQKFNWIVVKEIELIDSIRFANHVNYPKRKKTFLENLLS